MKRSDEALGNRSEGAVKVFSSKWRVAAAAAFLLLALYVLRPGASFLKSKVISSLSAGLGRSVDIGSVRIRVLPRPGFELDNLVVYDNPAFGAEPMLRASEVIADLRLMSLVRGRLEIARLDLNEPSLNLVHSEGGRWNLEALLESTARIPLARTGKTRTAPGFPYVAGTSGRINFKSGPEKKPYALTNADFSLWQESENVWGLRLRAQPFRTDLNLNDTGVLQVEGRWQRAAIFRETPLKFNVEWSRAQLGQVTKFFTGGDRGWRGEIELAMAVSGNPAKLRFGSFVSVDDFRRYDITNGRALRLAARCDGEYSSVNHAFSQVLCSAPVAKGAITLAGAMGRLGSHHYDVTLTAEDIPASAASLLAQRVKQNLPGDLSAEGTLQGKVSIREDGPGNAMQVEGKGEIAGLHLSSAANKAEVGPQSFPFVITNDSAANRQRRMLPKGPRVEFGPIALDTGHAGTATVQGWLDSGGYSARTSGDVEISRALRLARMMGLAAVTNAADGTAQFNLQIAGAWTGRGSEAVAGFSGPQVTGTARLRNVHVVPRGTGPVEISSADLQLLPETLRVRKLDAKAAGTTWTGSLELPRGCGTPETCPMRFSLNTAELSLNQVADWARTGVQNRPWYRALAGGASNAPSVLGRLHASGRITADRLQIRNVSARHVSADVNLDEGKMQMLALEGDLYGGRHRGKWLVDYSAKPAICAGSGNISGVSLASLADEMKDDWISGTAAGSYEIQGPCTAEFWQTAEATLQVSVEDGTLPHIVLGDDTEPLTLTRLAGEAKLHAGNVEINDAQLDSENDVYRLGGTVSLKGEVDLKLARIASGAAAAGYAITGTLAEPQVAPLKDAEQARLKR